MRNVTKAGTRLQNLLASQTGGVGREVISLTTQTAKCDAHGDSQINELKQWHQRLQQLEQSLSKQAERLEKLTAEAARAADEHDLAQAALQDVREMLAVNGISAANPSPYQQLVRRIHHTVPVYIPRQATILAISKGDPQLINFVGRTGWHFPRNAAGNYCGYHPACSTAAIANLEALRADGAEYLVVPSTAFWWLDHYRGFSQHLDRYYRLLVRLDDTCAIYALRATPSRAERAPTSRLAGMIEAFENRFDRDPVILDWDTGLGLGQLFPQLTVLSRVVGDGRLPYLDHSIDIVAVGSHASAAVDEARRVAFAAVIKPARATDSQGLFIEWMPGPPPAQPPSVSVIIPCYNGRKLTEACLESLFRTLPAGFRGEVIVVDDASTDDTAQTLNWWAERQPLLKVCRNLQNCGFVDSCNRGAREAIGDFLVFLNNDVLLLPGWLPPLLRTFRDFTKAGAVGAKLISPDGTLQEAGGIVFRDGSAMNFGRGGADLDAPVYNFVREVDYCSGALMATRRELFQELGGFATEYRPGYYEDTDYCFQLRERGFQVLYQPECAVVHREGGTAGRDSSAGMKQFQVINRLKFMSRWQNVLPRHLAPPAKLDTVALQQLALHCALETSRP